MKKLMIAVPFMLIFCFGQLFGQKNIFNISVESGTNLTFLHKNTTSFSSNPALGFAGGIAIQYNLSERIGIKTGIHFERRITKGSLEVTDENGMPDGNISANTRFDYMAVPLMAKITWENKGKFYYVNAGPQVGYLFRHIDNFRDYNSIDNTALFHNFDIGLSAGVGSMFPINQNLYLTTEIRGNLGLRDMLIDADQSVKINSINLLAGILYRL